MGPLCSGVCEPAPIVLDTGVATGRTSLCGQSLHQEKRPFAQDSRRRTSDDCCLAKHWAGPGPGLSIRPGPTSKYIKRGSCSVCPNETPAPRPVRQSRVAKQNECWRRQTEAALLISALPMSGLGLLRTEQHA